jgi:hypothetical protein
MEVALSRRQTEGPARNPPIDPRHEPRQPVLGRSAIHGELLKLGIDVDQTSVANIWQDTGDSHRKGGIRFCATTPVGLPQWIFSSY